jgi:hypothetical protein
MPAGALLGMAACLAMTTSGLCCLLPAHRHMAMPGEHQQPQPDQPMGCHAALGCAAHRKLKKLPEA